MPSVDLLEQLETNFPAIRFQEGKAFSWRPRDSTVVYVLGDPDFDQHLLHELSHALLEHTVYERDIDLIALERDAWGYARRTLAPLYDIAITSDCIEADLDTYRDWLHARSTCPQCEATGLQIKKMTYRCVSCHHTWRVNHAKLCQLRRYSVT